MFTLRMARREFRASWKGFLSSILAIALGVGAITGVQGLSHSLRHSLLRQSRQLIAADLRLRLNSLPRTEELTALDALRRQGADISAVTETVSMVGSAGDNEGGTNGDDRNTQADARTSGAPLLVSLKAVAPEYPYFGTVELQPALSLHEVLKESAVVSPDLLSRLGVKTGDRIRIGDRAFPIGAVLTKEPDRLASGVELGPRVLLSQQSLALTGLMQFGSRASYIYLVRLPEQRLTVERARALVREHSDRFRIVDYRDPNPGLTRGLERMTSFLSLTALLALLVGGLGVAASMHAYLQRKLDTIAVLKSLGGRSSQILRIYLAQTLIVASLGSLLGIGLGLLMQLALPRLLRGLLEVQATIEWSAAVPLQGLAIGLLATSALVLPTLLAIRDVPAAQVLRRDVDKSAPLTRAVGNRIQAGISLAAILAVIGIIATWLAGSWRRGFGFVGGAVIVIAVLVLVGRLLFPLAGRLWRPRHVAVRHGLANLRRPGSQAALTFAVLALGVTLTFTVYLLQTSLLKQLVRSAPPDFPNLILIGVAESQRPALWEYLRSAPEVLQAGEPVAAAPARLVSVDGQSPQDRIRADRGEDERRFSRPEFSLTWARDMPPQTTLLLGRWWKGEPAPAEISVGQFAAEALQLKLGSRLVFQSGARKIEGVVSSVREIESIAPAGANNQFIFSPGALQGLPQTYVGNVRAHPDGIPALQKALFEKFPTVTSIDVHDVLTLIRGLVDRIALVIQLVAAFAVAAGAVVLASGVAASRQRRLREAVLLKALGATRRTVAVMHGVEFASIGLLAGLVGSLGATILTWLLLRRVFQTEFQFDWPPVLAATGATALLTVTTGWLAGLSIRRQKPIEILREL